MAESLGSKASGAQRKDGAEGSAALGMVDIVRWSCVAVACGNKHLDLNRGICVGVVLFAVILEGSNLRNARDEEAISAK